MARLALVANPGSGSGEAERVERLLAAREPELIRFDLDDHAGLTGAAPERIVVAGGDGSIGSVAEVAAELAVPLAIVPVGTANDFARALGIPAETERAVELALSGDRTRVEKLGECRGEGDRRDQRRAFVNAASTGLSPIAAREAQGLKAKLGKLAYSVAAFRVGIQARPVVCTVRCDGDELFSGSAWQAIVACSGAFGGGAAVEPDPRHGILRAVVIEAGSRSRLLLHAFALRYGQDRGPGWRDRRRRDGSRGRGARRARVQHRRRASRRRTPALHDPAAGVRGRGRVRSFGDLRLEPPRLRRRESPGLAAWRRYRLTALTLGGAIAWYAADSLRHRREGAFGYEIDTEIAVGSADFLRAAEALTGAPISTGNEAELLINGDRIFPAMLETIAAAQRTLNVQTYVYWRGEIATRMAEAIADRARAGVDCNVILDALGAAKMKRPLIRLMADAGVRVVLFRPPKPYAVRRLVNRSHRRLLIADGRTGMTGGVGIAEEWTGDADDPEHWRDTHVRVRGPVVRGMQGAFAENWLEGTGEVLAGDDYLPDLDPVDEGGPMQLVRSSAKVGDTNAEALYYLAIASAQRSIDLTAAYFVPRPAFTDALASAAQRGVRVRILVPGPHIDKPIVRVAGRAAYQQLLDAGVALHEFQPTMLHAKTLSVDGAWSAVGTVNFDNRSFQLHDEVTLCVWDERFTGRLDEAFERDLERSQRIEPERWRRRPVRQRVAEASTKLLRREL